MKIADQIKFNRPGLLLHRRFVLFEAVVVALILALTGALRLVKADTATCGGGMITLPFNDILSSPNSSGFFCFIAQIYFQGVTVGTSATTYSPDNPVTRGQMAVFLARTEDLALKRGSRRAALNQWWTPQVLHTGMLTGGFGPVTDVVCDGVDLWTMGGRSQQVNRVRASDGVFLTSFSTRTATTGVVAGGRIYVAGGGTLSYIEKGAVTIVSSGFTPNLTCITYDGRNIWTGTDSGVIGKTSVVDNSVITVAGPGSFGLLQGMLFDGSNVWITEADPSGRQNGHIHRFDSGGAETLSVVTGIDPRRPIFDGTNIWVPNFGDNTITVIRASTGAVLATLMNNGLNGPTAAAFDGQRILVTNTSGNSVSLWKAADLSPLGSVNLVFAEGFSPTGVCSDGVNFWVVANTVGDTPELIRF